ncbi:MAG: hypothetical protein ACR2L2_02680 [Acidobacteriota bacterium]
MTEKSKEKTATSQKRAYVKPVIVVNTLVEARGTCRTAGTCSGASQIKNVSGGQACRVGF